MSKSKYPFILRKDYSSSIPYMYDILYKNVYLGYVYKCSKQERWSCFCSHLRLVKHSYFSDINDLRKQIFKQFKKHIKTINRLIDEYNKKPRDHYVKRIPLDKFKKEKDRV